MLCTVAGLLMISPNRTAACFCVPSGPPKEELAKATAVFSGQVAKIEPAVDTLWGNVESVKVTFEVSNVWKGPMHNTLEALTASSGINCGYQFKTGEQYLVYAHGSESRLEVWQCTRTKPLSMAKEDLAALGAGNTPGLEARNEVGIEVRTSPSVPGKREVTQSFVYFVPWDWLHGEGQLSQERVGFAFWNSPDKAPIVSSLRWHGSVYGGLVKKGIKLVLIEKIGNSARMTGPWEFFGDQHFRINVDDKPLVAEMNSSRVAIRQDVRMLASQVGKYTVKAGDTLSAIAQTFGTSVSAIAQANNIVNPNLIVTGQELVIPALKP